jgi:hypothetical protein
MSKTQHSSTEKIELVEVTHERLAEVSGGMYDAFRTSNVVEYSGTTYLGVTGATLGSALLNSTRTA